MAVQLHTFLSFPQDGSDQLYSLNAWMYQCKMQLLFARKWGMGGLQSQCRCSVAQKSNTCTKIGDKPRYKTRNPFPTPQFSMFSKILKENVFNNVRTYNTNPPVFRHWVREKHSSQSDKCTICCCLELNSSSPAIQPYIVTELTELPQTALRIQNDTTVNSWYRQEGAPPNNTHQKPSSPSPPTLHQGPRGTPEERPGDPERRPATATPSHQQCSVFQTPAVVRFCQYFMFRLWHGVVKCHYMNTAQDDSSLPSISSKVLTQNILCFEQPSIFLTMTNSMQKIPSWGSDSSSMSKEILCIKHIPKVSQYMLLHLCPEPDQSSPLPPNLFHKDPFQHYDKLWNLFT